MFRFSLSLSLIISVSGLLFQLYRFKSRSRLFEKEKKSHGSSSSFDVKEFLLNTFFQRKLFKAGKIRWIIHFLFFLSFLYLVVVHALDDVTSYVFLSDYESTFDPYQLLRNLTGFFVLAGCVVFLIRRSLKTRINQDKKIKFKGFFSVILVLMVIVSGFLLEAVKIISEPVFMEMVEEYSDIDEEPDLSDLKLYWEKNYNVVFDETLEFSKDRLANGEVLHQDYCLSCHSSIKSAFVSNSLAKNMRATGNVLNRHRIDEFLYVIHYMLCFLMLVSLPFSRLFHVLLIPFSSSRKQHDIEKFQNHTAYIQPATLYACTNCGYCSEVCSVYPNFQITGNKDTLPHSKIESIKKMMQDSCSLDLDQLQSGNAECTMCHNCTDICPSGIDLQSLWHTLDHKFIKMGYFSNDQIIKETPIHEWVNAECENSDSDEELTTDLADKVDSFENCIQCTICTNVCPVVEYDSSHNDMTPHQIMNLLRLGKKNMATGTLMVWNCLTCYSCQEQCPQDIQVADILQELRNNGSVMADRMKQNQLTKKVSK